MSNKLSKIGTVIKNNRGEILKRAAIAAVSIAVVTVAAGLLKKGDPVIVIEEVLETLE